VLGGFFLSSEWIQSSKGILEQIGKLEEKKDKDRLDQSIDRKKGESACEVKPDLCSCVAISIDRSIEERGDDNGGYSYDQELPRHHALYLSRLVSQEKVAGARPL